jgi:4-amino-4-deoxy-L-arabinose transferase-like glycosyltransferase
VALLVLRQLAALTVLTAASWLVGRAVARLPLREPVGRFAFRVGAGLGTLGVALFLLGLFKCLTAAAVLLLAGAAALLVFVPGEGGDPAPANPTGGLRRGEVIAAALLVLPAFVLSLYPPTGFDETMYHLPYASTFAASHRLAVVPEHLFPVSPQLLEMLFSAALLLAGDVATHTVQFLCMAAAAAAVFAFGQRFGGPRAGLLGAALWLANPLVHYQAATSYVDLGYTLFAVLAIFAWELWREEGSSRWLVAGGVFCGLAADTKYLGLYWMAALVLATFLAAPRGRRSSRAGLLSVFALASLTPWYLRNALVTGNPVFPFLSNWIPGARTEGYASGWAGLGTWFSGNLLGGLRRPVSMFTLPWRVAFDTAGFGGASPLSPYYLLILPLMAWQARGDSRFRRWLFLLVAYVAAGTAYDPRFQLPSAALLAVAGGIALARLLERPRAAFLRGEGAAAALALGLAALGPAYAVYKIFRHGAPPSNPAAREAFLERELPGYDAIGALNRSCGASYTVFAIGGQNLAYYAKGRFLGQAGGPFARRHVEPTYGSPEELRDRLVEWGVDFLYVSPTRRADAPDLRNLEFRRWFLTVLQTPGSDLYALRGPDGRPRSPCVPDRVPPAATEHVEARALR